MKTTVRSVLHDAFFISGTKAGFVLIIALIGVTLLLGGVYAYDKFLNVGCNAQPVVHVNNASSWVIIHFHADLTCASLSDIHNRETILRGLKGGSSETLLPKMKDRFLLKFKVYARKETGNERSYFESEIISDQRGQIRLVFSEEEMEQYSR